MMKNIFAIILSFFYLAAVAQEQITNVIEASSSTRYIMKEVNGENYIMTTVASDSLRVYKLVNGTSIYQYGRKFDGVYKIYKYETTDHFLLMENASGALAYDFTNNTIVRIPYENGLVNTRWYTDEALGDEIVVLQYSKDLTVRKYVLYDLTTNRSQELPSKFAFRALGTKHLYFSTFASDTTQQIYILNKENLVAVDSFTIPVFNSSRLFFDGDDYMVYNTKSKINRYNFANKTHEVIRTIDSTFLAVKLSKRNDEYVIEMESSFSHNMIRINSKTLVSHEFLISGETYSPYPDVLYGKYLVFRGFSWVAIDTTTGEKFNYRADSNPNSIAVLDNRYVVYLNFDQHIMLDLATMQTYVLAEMPDRIYTRSIETMIHNGIHYINYDNNGKNIKLLEVDLSAKSGKYSTIIPISNEGLIAESKLIKVLDDLLLVNSKNLYLVKGNSTIQLNTVPITNVRFADYKVSNDIFYWCEVVNTEYNIYKLHEGKAILVASIPSQLSAPPNDKINLYDYVVTATDIYIDTNYENIKYRYNLQTKQMIEVTKLKSLENHGYYYKGSYYYTDNDKIVIIKSNASTISIKVNLNYSFINPFLTYKDRLFYVDPNGLYEITNDQLNMRVPLLNGLQVVISEYNGYIWVNNFIEEYLYDGTRKYTLNKANNQSRGEYLFNDYYALYTSTAINSSEASIVNFKTNATITLPTELAKLKFIRGFKNIGKHILLGLDGVSPFNKVVLFETDENLSFFSKFKEIDVTSNGIISTFTEYTNEGFLYTGNTMYLMDTLLNFVPINGLTGESQSSSVFEQDGYFYFVAIDPIEGRQLFRIQLASRTTAVEDINSISKVGFYPNPANNDIYVEGGNYTYAEIYNLAGVLVQNSSLKENHIIDVSKLRSGSYLLVLSTQSGVKSIGKFIKVDN